MSFDYKKVLPHLAAIVVFVLISSAYFLPQFSGKTLTQSDIISHKATSQEIREHREATGEEVLWTNSLFSGMPSYMISVRHKSNLLNYVKRAMSLWIKGPAGMFIFGMIGFYLLMMTLGVNPYLSIVASILYAFGTNQIVLLEAGHNTKILTLFSLAPIIGGVLLTYRGEFLKGGLIFAFAMGINILCNHPQMTYYMGMALLPLIIMLLVQSIRKGEVPLFAKASGVLLIGLMLGMGANASRLMTNLDYAKDTMRGKPILETESSGPKTSSETNGLEWNYAMSWSNGTSDLMASWIPNVVGGRTVDFVDKDSPYAKAIGQRRDVQTYVYFGSLNSTAGPVYFGAVVFTLFFLALFMTTGIARWWSLAGVILTFMISLGSNLEWFNRLLFDYLPYFNKFRAHSSVTGVTGVIVAFGAFYGLSKIMAEEDKSRMIKPFLMGTGILAGFTLLVALLGPSLVDLSSPRDGQFAQNPKVLDALLDTRAGIMRSSALRSLAFVLATAGVLYLFLKNKMSSGLVIGAIALLGIIDIIPVDQHYVSNENFVPKRRYQANFNPTPADTQILKDTDPHYRVMDTQRFNQAGPSYFHKHIGGYHPAKLQRYEDLKNKYLISSTGEVINNMNVINMLNTKYVIVYDAQGQPSVQRNTAALGNAWFVNSIRSVDNANQELDVLGNMDTRLEAAVHKEFSDYMSGFTGGKKAGQIQLTTYAPDELTYAADVPSEQFAVFSEIYYKDGWNAYIDGQKVDHIRVNYTLRGMRIPAGKHEIRFAFEPSTYATGSMISLICSLLLLLGGLGFFFKDYLPGWREVG